MGVLAYVISLSGNRPYHDNAPFHLFTTQDRK
jgi:hypothetical protein